MRAVGVIIKKKKVIDYITEYRCPSCHVETIGAGVGENTTRFRCHNCNRELIIKDIIEE